MRPLALAVAVASAGCIGTPEGSREIPILDFQMYADAVQPVLAERCGNPTCHGRPDRPFSIYSEGRFRLDPEQTHEAGPLSPEEMLASYESACGFSVGVEAPGECLLLAKPLSVGAGGVGHLGGDVWTDPRETEYRTLESWIATAGPREE